MGLRQSLKRLTERKKLGEILVELNLLTPEQLKQALEESSKNSILLGSYLISAGLVTEEQMTKALSQQFGLPAVDLRRQQISSEVVKLVPEKVARQYNILPVLFDGNSNTLTVAVHDPLNIVNLNSVQALSGMNLVVVIAPESQLKTAIKRAYQGESDTKFVQLVKNNIHRVDPATTSAGAPSSLGEEVSGDRRFSVETLLNKIFESALESKASDIHFEPAKDKIRVRCRVDGSLHEVQTLPIDLLASLISRIKILGNMDIAEKRQPQDGHFQIKVGQRDVDFRVSTLPIVGGEKAVIRILDKSAQRTSLADIGMGHEILTSVKKLLARPHGVILVTGPTGSGKTTTVYSMIREVNDNSLNLVTIEDPVEFQIDNVNQVQVNVKAGVQFSNTLRAVLRQDPDVIMVGEIRDRDTAEVAVQAALTGHLVISTLHTNDSAGTLSRLVEMGIEPFLVSSSLLGVVAQRLVRKLCKHCKEPGAITEEERELLGSAIVPEGVQIYRAKGCPKCNNIGYRGRIGIFELLIPDAEIRKLISSGKVDEPLRNYLWEQKFHSMRFDGIDKVIEGVTSVEEVVKETI